MAGVIRSKLEFMGSRMFGAVHAVCRPQHPGSQTLMTFAGQGLAAPTEALAPVAPRGFMDAFRLLAVPKKKISPHRRGQRRNAIQKQTKPAKVIFKCTISRASADDAMAFRNPRKCGRLQPAKLYCREC